MHLYLNNLRALSIQLAKRNIGNVRQPVYSGLPSPRNLPLSTGYSASLHSPYVIDAYLLFSPCSRKNTPTRPTPTNPISQFVHKPHPQTIVHPARYITRLVRAESQLRPRRKSDRSSGSPIHLRASFPGVAQREFRAAARRSKQRPVYRSGVIARLAMCSTASLARCSCSKSRGDYAAGLSGGQPLFAQVSIRLRGPILSAMSGRDCEAAPGAAVGKLFCGKRAGFGRARSNEAREDQVQTPRGQISIRLAKSMSGNNKQR